MDQHSFDELTRSLARGLSRRGVLRALAGGAAGLALGAVRGESRLAEAAKTTRPPKPGSKPPGSRCKSGGECAPGTTGFSACCNGTCCSSGVCDSSGACVPCDTGDICGSQLQCCAAGEVCTSTGTGDSTCCPAAQACKGQCCAAGQQCVGGLLCCDADKVCGEHGGACCGAGTVCALNRDTGLSGCCDVTSGAVEICGGYCIPTCDAANCMVCDGQGGCRSACGDGETCQAGTCVASVCPTGLSLCTWENVDGSLGQGCADLNNSMTNCGECGHWCASQLCRGGVCQCQDGAELCTFNNQTTCCPSVNDYGYALSCNPDINGFCDYPGSPG